MMSLFFATASRQTRQTGRPPQDSIRRLSVASAPIFDLDQENRTQRSVTSLRIPEQPARQPRPLTVSPETRASRDPRNHGFSYANACRYYINTRRRAPQPDRIRHAVRPAVRARCGTGHAHTANTFRPHFRKKPGAAAHRSQ
ncbi:hypothetical protein [Burkholderia anthina]|uniref:hypothetical protein n=1 Tax=Burkholderia anthina TaxID=179879 RepID=UPI001588C421|nr:hypothetical protein [Burkholderia anthina]